MNGDNLIYEMRHGKMVRTANKIRSTPEHNNFVIVCQHGDWSGFRTLPGCEKQFAELEAYNSVNSSRVYSVVER